ncbi:hypothetical protein [Hymenobacter sp.]|uniref:hypothetical protein n=1 Tax=Hymenobacter sp. TaxID=1898978 RepID=UPI00286D36F2|nr:hypothetical protein [Hymenobacter sp.]
MVTADTSSLLSSLPDADGSRCTLAYEEAGPWLRATWRGFVDMQEALRGAESYLRALAALRCPYLLNDNAALRGPWFDSLEWLERIWVPQAVQMGLRYVAHVVQADGLSDGLVLHVRGVLAGRLELQIFQQVPEAEAWLRSCHKTDSRPAPPRA